MRINSFDISLKKEYFLVSSLLGLFLLSILLLDIRSFSILLILIPSLLAFFFIVVEDKNIFFFLVFISSVLFLESGDGITIFDGIYFLIMASFLILYLAPSLISLNCSINTDLDKYFIALLIIIAYSILLGVINGANFYNIFGDGAYYLPIPTYFALRKLMEYKNWRKILLFSIGLIFLYVSIRNMYNYRQLLISAYLQWQTERARDSSNELLLLSGSILFFNFSLFTKKNSQTVLYFVLFSITFIGLLITQSRGYWLAFLVSFFSLFCIIGKKEQKKLIILSSISIILSSSLAFIFFYNELQIIINGLLERFQSIGEARLDLSLRERILESQMVVSKIFQNPIAGYGFGTTYRREALFYNIIQYRSFIHNGYLLIWYKSGLIALIIYVSLFYKLIKMSYASYLNSKARVHKVLSSSIFSILLGMLLVNNTSPQFYHFDSLLILALISAYLNYSHEFKR